MATEADATMTEVVSDVQALKAEVYDLLERQAEIDAARAMLQQQIQDKRKAIARLSATNAETSA